MEKPTISQMAELLRLRGLLQEISQISMAYSVMNKRYPIHEVTIIQADELILEYKRLLQRAITSLEVENYGQSNATT